MTGTVTDLGRRPADGLGTPAPGPLDPPPPAPERAGTGPLRATAGSEAGFEAGFEADAATAYRELAPAVLGYLRARRVPDPEDVLGEVFLQVSRDLDRFHGDATDLRRWVFTIAHNRMTDAFRRRSRRPRIVDRRPPAAVAPPAPDPVDDELIAALAELGDDQREVVVLRFVADLSLEDVAAITGRTANAVKAMQHRALANLRRTLTEHSSRSEGLVRAG